MTKKLHIATDFTLPIEFASMTSAALGIRGSGKTTTAAVAFEELLTVGYQVIAIDPTDVWHGLKSSADGKRPGFPIVVLGGPHGDLPIDAAAGSTIADFLVEHQASAVLSLRHLRKADQRRFVTDFSERFYFRKGEAANRTPVLLAIDECDAFIPQRVGGAEARMVGAIEDLVRRGRASGIGVMLISQRAASINKDVLTQIELLIAHRHTSPQDRKALELWIEAHDTAGRQQEFMANVASLAVGTAWFWSPGWLDCFRPVEVRSRKTFDSSATPKPGQKAAAPKEVAKVDLNRLKEQLKSTIEQAAANDPKELKRQIAELKKELVKKQPAEIDDRTAEKIRSEAIATHDRLWKETVKELQRQHKDYGSRLAKIASLAHVNGDAVEYKPPAVAEKPKQIAKATPRDKPIPSDAAAASVTLIAGGESLGKAERSVLGALFWLRDETATPPKVAFYSGYSVTSSSFTNALSGLRTKGLIAGWKITTDGESLIADVVGYKPSGSELRESLRRKLGKAENTLLDCLIESHPKLVTYAELSEASGYSESSSSFTNALSTLRTIEAIEGSKREGGIRASDVFLE